MSSVPWFRFTPSQAAVASSDLERGDGSHQRAGRFRPVSRRRGSDDDARTRFPPHVAGDLGEVIRLDLGDVGVDHARSGPAQESHLIVLRPWGAAVPLFSAVVPLATGSLRAASARHARTGGSGPTGGSSGARDRPVPRLWPPRAPPP